MSRRSNSPPPPPDRFSRSNFAPLPNRHAAEFGITPSTKGNGSGAAEKSSGNGKGGVDTYIPPPGPDTYIPPPPPRDDRPLRDDRPSRDGMRGEERRGREPLPIRERDILPVGTREWDGPDMREGREERRRRPPPHWEEEGMSHFPISPFLDRKAKLLDRPKRRRSPSPSYSTHRPRRHSPDHSTHSYGLPDPASLPNQLTFKQFAEWFRANHPNTAKADEEEFKRYKSGMMDEETSGGKERVGMGKRYERYRKEYTSRQVSHGLD